jgi:hypothetical protein
MDLQYRSVFKSRLVCQEGKTGSFNQLSRVLAASVFARGQSEAGARYDIQPRNPHLADLVGRHSTT